MGGISLQQWGPRIFIGNLRKFLTSSILQNAESPVKLCIYKKRSHRKLQQLCLFSTILSIEFFVAI